MTHIGTYSLSMSMPKKQIRHEGHMNRGIQSIVMPKTVGDKKTSSQEDGSSNASKRKTPSTTSKNKAKTQEMVVIVNPFPKIPLGKLKVGTGKLRKRPKMMRKHKPIKHKSGHNSKHLVM